jgi:prevent-host-death family protein
MKRITATQAKQNFGELIEHAQREGPVAIERHGRVVAYVVSPEAYAAGGAGPSAQARIGFDDYPGLKLITWDRAVRDAPPREVFELYERRWKHLPPLDAREKALVERLAASYGKGLLNV